MCVSDLASLAAIHTLNDVIEFVYTINFIRLKQSSSNSGFLEPLVIWIRAVVKIMARKRL